MNRYSPSNLTFLLIIGLALNAACQKHVTLRAPDSSAAALERIDAYKKLRPRGQMDVITLQNGVAVSNTTEYIILGDGSRVYYAEDLLGAVHEDSPTAKAARRSKVNLESSKNWGWGYVAGTTAGLVAMTGGVLADSDASVSLLLIGAALAVGSNVGLIGSLIYGKRAQDEKATAFVTYSDDLRKKLELCVDGLKLVPCV